MSGRSSRVKGFSYEREVVNQAKDAGIPAKRAWGSDGRSLGLDPEADVVIGGRPFQCKRTKVISSRFTPSPGIYGQLIRADRQESLVVIRYKDYLQLLTVTE